MGFLVGKRALIVGLASNRSIAYGIARAMHREGAELAFTYQNDKLKPRVEKMAAEFGSTLTWPCDVSNDAEIDAVAEALAGAWPEGYDIVVHSVAFAPGEALDGDFLDGISRENFRIAHDVSSYSFAALAKATRPKLRAGGALLTLSYLGAMRSIPNYNVMGLAKASLEANVRYLAATLSPAQLDADGKFVAHGVRVNAISAGPIRTLAASGIAGFRKMLEAFEAAAPTRQCVTIDEVGNVAAFLCSDLASGMTGEIVYVDGGFHNVAMANL